MHQKIRKSEWHVPAIEIADEPRYGWRGFMLDVGRHYFPKAAIKRYIDYLAMIKMNVFHWHLVEGNGWRIMTFKVYKGQDLLEHELKWFSPKHGEELNNEVVDVYFTFPQHWDNSKRFEKFDLTIVDVVKST